MRSLFLLSLFGLWSVNLFAQVTKVNIAEHFTNSNCSVCANNNPTIYSDLAAYSQTLHISIHPSSPYSSCYFSLQNPVENDGRTNFYGIYGSTPKVVLNGTLIAYSNLSAYLAAIQSDSSNFSLNIIQQWISSDSVMVKVSIKKVAQDSTSQALLYLAATQDTVQKLTGNGETLHHDVLRKSMTVAGGSIINLPVNVNDSLVQTFGYKMLPNWSSIAMKATGILQRVSNKEVIQSNRSASILAPTHLSSINKEISVVYPNPANNLLYFPLWKDYQSISIFTLDGRKVLSQESVTETLDISSVSNGTYWVSIQHIQGQRSSAIIQINK